MHCPSVDLKEFIDLMNKYDAMIKSSQSLTDEASACYAAASKCKQFSEELIKIADQMIDHQIYLIDKKIKT